MLALSLRRDKIYEEIARIRRRQTITDQDRTVFNKLKGELIDQEEGILTGLSIMGVPGLIFFSYLLWYYPLEVISIGPIANSLDIPLWIPLSLAIAMIVYCFQGSIRTIRRYKAMHL